MKKCLFNIFYNKMFIVICIISVILTSGHAYQTMFYDLCYIPIVMSIIFLFPIGYAYVTNKLNIYLGSLIIFFVMIDLTCIYYMGQNLYNYIFFFCGIIFAFGIVIMYDFQCFISTFIRIMDVVSAIGLIGYYLSNNTSFLDNLPMVVNIHHSSYRASFLYSFITTIPKRNCGMFWEPGLFATFLIYAILCELVFRNKKPCYMRLLLYSGCIITTNSSAGFLLWTICLILLLLSKMNHKVKRKRFYIVNLVIFSGFILFIMNLDYIILNTPLVENDYVAKLLVKNIKSNSRYNAVIHNLQVFSKSPLVGVGKKEAIRQIKHVADTSTTTYLMSLFGVLGASYTMYFIYGVWKVKSWNAYTKICVLAILLSIINKAPHMNNIFTWCMLFYLLKNSTCFRWTNPISKGELSENIYKMKFRE